MKIKTTFLIVGTWLFVGGNVFAQEKDTNQLKIFGHVDTYYAMYSNYVNQQNFQPYETAGARGNTFGINIAELGFQYASNKVRGNFIFHEGDIPKATWSNNFNNLQEANVGFKLDDNFWFDIGFFPTHIGTESFLPRNNMLGQTSFITYNEPFYQAGAKLSIEARSDWYIELWLANGYNRHVDNNAAKSVGMLLKKDFSKQTSLTYTNLYGIESEDNANLRQVRFYQNIYLNQNWKDKVLFTVGVDVGSQTNTDLDRIHNVNVSALETAYMYTVLAVLRYQFNPQFSITSRYERSDDPDGFINGIYLTGYLLSATSAFPRFEGMKLNGYSLGAEYKPNISSYVRMEGRYLQAGENQNIFEEGNTFTNDRLELLFTFGFYTEKLFKW